MTLTLGLTAFVIEIVLGITLGIVAARQKGRWSDKTLLALTLVVISIPVFVLGFVAQYIFGVKLGWLPPAGIADGWPISYIMPAFVLAGLSLAYVLRLTRSKLLETFNADFMRTARAKGLPQRDHHPQVRAAQLPDPGRHLPGHRPRRAAGRGGRHRGHLQHPGRRPAAVHLDQAAGDRRGRRLRHIIVIIFNLS